jgi:hypothetical protein
MKDGLAVLTWGKHSHPCYLMSAVNGQQHRLRRHFLGVSWANHNLAFPDATHQDNMADGYAFLGCEFLDAFRKRIAILEFDNENSAQLSFS